MKRLTEFISSVRATLVAGLAILICAGIVLALSTREEDAILEAAFDQQQYASHMERQVGSIEHIVDQYLLDQARYLPVATPDPDFIHIESGGILPFDPADFPREFIQSLVPETNGVITTCEITVYEDLKTRERKILSFPQIRHIVPICIHKFIYPHIRAVASGFTVYVYGWRASAEGKRKVFVISRLDLANRYTFGYRAGEVAQCIGRFRAAARRRKGRVTCVYGSRRQLLPRQEAHQRW